MSTIGPWNGFAGAARIAAHGQCNAASQGDLEFPPPAHGRLLRQLCSSSRRSSADPNPADDRQLLVGLPAGARPASLIGRSPGRSLLIIRNQSKQSGSLGDDPGTAQRSSDGRRRRSRPTIVRRSSTRSCRRSSSIAAGPVVDDRRLCLPRPSIANGYVADNRQLLFSRTSVRPTTADHAGTDHRRR